MKKFIFKNKLVIFVLILGALLRFWNLGVVPPSPNWDEVALGYNAYSLLTTGKDEYGITLPLSLRSYDDYKPPLYMYLTVPSVAMFGLSVWSTRLPAVILGLFAVLGVYILTHQLLSFSNLSGRAKGNISLCTMVLFSLSPWHLQFSRMAFESGVGLAIVIWAVVFFFVGLRQPRLFSISAFLFGLSLYAYHSQRIFAPLLVFSLTFIFRKELISLKAKLILPIIVGFATVLPLIPIFLDATTLTRLRGTSAIADQTGLLAESVQKLEQAQRQNDYLGILFNNRRVVYAKTILEGYTSHFSLGWLFIRGDNARHHAPDMGLLYLWELPFLLFGMYLVGKIGGKTSRVVYSWLLIAPIAASPTTELPHAIRTMTFLPIVQVFVGLGIYGTFGLIKDFGQIKKVGVYIILFFVILFGITNYLSLYHTHQNREFSEFWQYGYQQAVTYVNEQGRLYEKIIVSTKLEQPHMFFLFFLKYNPVLYLSEGGTASGGFAEKRNKFANFEFRPIIWNQENRDNRTLYIGTPSEIPVANKKTIYYLNEKEAIRIAD